ncbi:2-hydroxyacid dehydrogenase [Aerococcus urinae]|uniref:2-hydroxyacid dehydrogenase n=1 Tax=Aerococcus urinae TaxID=1376 RepID=UPI00254BCD8E|nr:2-hydroxyacid dehydrogenase [Aerococcus urinae]MDK7716574.1 2-hydroxyacid dehydrogenase [Aerococcus urinae]
MKIVSVQPLNVAKELIDELAQPLIEAGHDFVYYEEKTTDPEEMAKRTEGAEILIIDSTPFPEEVASKLEDTQLVDVAFTGVDHVAMDVLKEKGIMVNNASGYANQAVAELSLGLTLALYRHLQANDQETRKGSQLSQVFQGREIAGKTVGIIGTGSIGLATAALFKTFGANLIAYSRSEKEEAKALGIEYHSLEEVMAESDIISIHLPNNPQTKGMISKEMIGKMKSSAVLINVARGPIVDNEALAQALNDEKIAGAGIDVFDSEPPLADDYPLLHAKNIQLTPHVGYLTDEAMVKLARIAFDNIYHYLKDDPQNIVSE